MDLLEAIREALDGTTICFIDNPYNPGAWTTEVHRQIGDLAANYAISIGIGCGHEAGLSPGNQRLMVHNTGRRAPAIDSQFLFDQCWLACYDNQADENTHGYLTRCHLAVETEWIINDQEINRDFTKLTCGKADVKVMVCIAKDDPTNILHQLRNQIEHFEPKLRGEKYLLSVFSADHKRFYHETVTC